MLQLEQKTVSPTPASGRRLVTVTQRCSNFAQAMARIKRTRAFEEWRQRLGSMDRLPRGSFFKGKQPGRKSFVMDEFHRL